jgi:hypothetical protein
MNLDPVRSDVPADRGGARAAWRRVGSAVHERHAWLLRALLWIVGILIAVAVLGFLAAPYILKPVLERRLSEALDRKVTIARLDINPFALSATLHEVSIAGRDAGPPLLAFDELYMNASSASFFRWAPVVKELKLTRPTMNLVRNADKTYNISDLIDLALAPGPTPAFSVSNIEVVDGHIVFDDRPEHRQYQVTDLKLGIPFISSLPTQTEIKVEPVLSALVNDHRVAITGETRPFMDTRETVLHFDFTGLQLVNYIDYVPVALPFKAESGQLDGKLDLSFVGHGKDPPELKLKGMLRVADLAVNERSGPKLVRAQTLAVDIGELDLIGNRADLRSITADGLNLEVRRTADGTLNLAALAPADKRPAAPGPPFRFRVGNIAVNRGTVHLADASVTPAFDSTLTDIAIAIKNLASSGDARADVTASFSTDRGSHWSEHGTLALNPVRADGKLEIAGLKLDVLFPYYGSALNLVVDDGTLGGTTDFHFDGSATSPALALSALDAKVSDLKLRDPDEKEPMWRVPAIAVHGGSVDAIKHVVTFELVESRGAVATIRRDASGELNFQRLVRTSAKGVTPTGGENTWQVDLAKLTVDDYSATVTDETVSPAAHFALSRLALKVENFSNIGKGSGRATLLATVGKRGSVSLSGPFSRSPFATTLDVVAKDIDLVPFQAYLTREARIVLTGGAASARGSINFSGETPIRAGFKGDVTLTDIVALDDANATDLLKWKSLTLGSVDAQLEPLAVNIGSVALDNFFARLLLNENGEFNLQQLERSRPPATAPPTPTNEPKTVEVATPPGTATTWLRVGKTTLSNGDIDYTDHFIRPNYSADLTGVTGSLSTLAFDQPADIDLHGSVQGSAPVDITGRINPLAKDLFLDVKVNATDIELPPLTPYSGKYIGYGITKGKLSMKVSYLIENRKLTAQNSIILNQLTFGDKVESPDAIKAPVLLAVALLKDRNGNIEFDLPVSGSLDDPKFSVGGLVFRALVNLILKAVTAPFALLGSLAGSHGEELAYVEFAPGSAVLDQVGNSKTKSVAKALTDRPALKLDIAGRVDPGQDRDALKHAAVERQVKLQKFNDLVKSGEPPPSVDAVEVSPTEYEPLLTRAYKAADIPNKPRNVIGLQKDLPRDEMEAALLANTKVGDEDLRALADRRADAVRASIVEGEHAPEERVFVVAPRLSAEGIKDKGKTTRVDFALR